MHSGEKVSDPCYSSAQCLPLTYIVHRCRLLYARRKCLYSDNVLLQTLARCCYVASLSDVHKFTIKNFTDLNKHCAKELCCVERVCAFAYFVTDSISTLLHMCSS